ncbi:MAG: DUF5011 domain-containing protein [Bacteroidales bacterium]
MKKILLPVAALTMIIGATLLNSCTKDDTTAPVITLNGSGATLTLDLGDTYTEAATASDDKDGDITSSIVKTGTVNTSQVGEYVIKYNVTDAAGNSAQEVTRTVKVRSDRLAGTYAISNVVSGGPGVGTWTYTVTVTQSSTDYNKLNISNFSGWGAAVTVYILVSGANITVPSQHPTGVPAGSEGTAEGTSGTYSVTGASTSLCKINTLNYNWSYDTSGIDNCSETWTKQ